MRTSLGALTHKQMGLESGISAFQNLVTFFLPLCIRLGAVDHSNQTSDQDERWSNLLAENEVENTDIPLAEFLLRPPSNWLGCDGMAAISSNITFATSAAVSIILR